MNDIAQRLAALPASLRVELEAYLHEQPGALNTFPLSYAQQRLWLLDQLQPDNVSYTIPASFLLQGPLQQEALEQSIAQVLQRHEVLRTTIVVINERPLQVIAPPGPFTLQLIDLSAMINHEEQAHAAQRVIDQEGARTFDLSSGPLIRFLLIRLAPTTHILFLAMHHICSDGWSITIIAHELAALYPACVAGNLSPLPPLPIQYADYACWQHGQSHDTVQQRQMNYWRERLQGAPPFLELPTDYQRPAMQTSRHGEASLRIEQPLSTALIACGRQEGTTLFMTLLTIFQILLYRQTGQPDLIVGTPIANRNRPEIEDLIGFFVNTLALRFDLTGNPTFRDRLAATRETCLGAYSNQDVSFDRLLEELHHPRDLSYSPIYQIFFNMENVPDMPDHWGDLTVTSPAMHDYGAKFDLTVFVTEDRDGIDLRVVYNADLFTADRIRELLEQYVILAKQCLAEPAQPISQFSLITPTARTRLPNPTAPLSAAWEGSVTELFARQAAQWPDQVAIIATDAEWSYRALDNRCNQLAHRLQAHHVQPGDVIAIYAYRNAALIVAILGILKIGAAYIILDPTYPPARLMEYVEQGQPRGYIIIDQTDPLPAELATYLAQVNCPCLAHVERTPDHGAESDLSAYSSQPVTVTIGPDDLASITFTSGSTGRPKGILQRHGPLTHFLPWFASTFALTAADRHSMLSGLAHDPLQRDIFTPLCLGATVCIPDPNEMGNPGWIAHWMARQGITITNLTPAMVQLVTQPSPGKVAPRLPALRYALTVGDSLKRHDIARLWALAPVVNCVNLFGSTETQRAVSFYPIPRPAAGEQSPLVKEVIPIGQGIEDAQLLIITPAGQLAGIGELGEIYMRSPHLARGYLNNSELTSDRFIVNPFTKIPTDRIYKTGDLGRYLPSGDVEYLVRVDQQVKIRGFRIELGEIEAVLTDHPLIQDVAVLAYTTSQGDNYLAAYVVTGRDDTDADLSTKLRSYLQQKLPSYMIPTTYSVLAALPMTPNGKLDRQALPPPHHTTQSSRNTIPPRTPTETILAEIWMEILGIDQISVTDNFFDLGGHSLKATQLIARIADATGVRVALRTLFEVSTIASLAPIIDSADVRKTQVPAIPIARLARSGVPDQSPSP